MTSINELFAARVLEFTRAEAILTALVVDIDNMKSSLGSKLTNRDDTLATALAGFRSGAVGQWLNATTLESAIEYDQARTAAIGRARSLERRAYAAAEAAQALAALLEATAPLITTDDLAWRIDCLAHKFYDGQYATDTAAEPDLTALWQSLTPSALVSPEAVENLRRLYDTRITSPYTGQNLPGLYPVVTDWREHHLSSGAWDGDTWAYAVDTLRSWDEAATLWHALADDRRRGDLTAAENVRLRTALADRVKEVADGNPGAPRELVEAVTEFDNAHMWLMMRIRAAETMADLNTVALALLDRGRNADGFLTLMRALGRRFDILTTTAPDADNDNEWAPANVLHNIVANWRTDIYNAAMACTTAAGGRDYDETARYTLLDCAIADARHTGKREHVANLLDRIARVAEAGADHILTSEHIERLNAAATQGDTTAIELNGGNHQ